MGDKDAPSRPDYADFTIVLNGTERLDFEWVGVAGEGHGSRPRVYDPSAETEYKAELDQVNEQVVVDPEAGRDLPAAALGGVVDQIGDWQWLSPFGRAAASDEETISE